MQAVPEGFPEPGRKSKRKYRVRYLVGLAWLAIVLAFASQEGLAGVAAVSLLLIAFPVIAWFLIRKLRTPDRLLRLFSNDAKFPVEFFFDPSFSAHANIEWRTVEMILAVLGISSFFVQRFVQVSFLSETALALFVVFIVIAASISPLILVPAWVYEDSGFRRYNKSRSTVTTPLERAKGIVVFGGLGAYISFATTLAGSWAAAGSLTVALLFLLTPLCYLITTLFHDRMETQAVRGLRAVRVTMKLPERSVRVE